MLVLQSTILLCGDNFVGSAAYQKLGMDARIIAMGRTGSVASRGAEAVFWNPAHLCIRKSRRRFDVILSYMSENNYDIEFITSGIAWQAEYLGLGVGLMHYRVGDIHHYDENMNYFGTFSNIENSGFFSMAFKIPYVMNIGITIQHMSQKYTYDSDRYNTFGIRGGIAVPFYKYPQLTLSMSYNNRSFERVDQNNLIRNEVTRPAVASGIQWHMQEKDRTFLKQVIICSEIEQEKQFPLKLKFGTEVYTVNVQEFKLYLRFGLDDIDIETRATDGLETDLTLNELILLNMKKTFGFGITFPSLNVFGNRIHYKFEYAYVSEAFRDLHFITIGSTF